MKATIQDKHITLQNGVRFLIGDQESREEFKTRVTTTVERDYCELLFIEDEATPNFEREAHESEVIEEATSQEATPVGATLADVEYYYSKKNVDKQCSFPKRSTGEIITGRIAQVYLDKRKNLTYYRIRDESGKLHIKRVNAKNLKII